MDLTKYTRLAKQAIERAEKVAKGMGQSFVGTEHMLLSLVENKGVASQVLMQNGATSEKIREVIQDVLAEGSSIPVAEKGLYTPRLKKILDNAIKLAQKNQTEKAGTEHILLAILHEQECIAVRILATLGLNLQNIYVELLSSTGVDAVAARNDFLTHKNTKKKSQTPVLDAFGTDLTKAAKEGNLDAVIGRDLETERMIRILSRRTKNNPCLIGEPGVGKTAVVEGLAIKIVNEDVPEHLLGVRLINLDIAGMVAGSKYRGEFEERIKRALSEASAAGNVLLFIDEIHTVIGAGNSDGSTDAANILKPSLARGEIRLIGATTREEYRKKIEKDAALERRFQSVVIEEPSVEATIEMLRGVADLYAKHHKVTIKDEALIAAAKLSARFVSDRFLPDKAIDALDEACARTGMRKSLPSPEIRQMEEQIVELEKEKEDAIIHEEYMIASEKKREQQAIEEKIEKLKNERSSNAKATKEFTVTEEHIADVIADWTKIPVQKIQAEENERLKNLEEYLHERVIGQHEAVKAVARATRRGRTGLKDPNRPIGSFLFLGPTGVGKTELSKTLADAVFGESSEIIRVDMSEYMEKHSVSKMIGSPPGYVGYDDGGQLSEKVRRHPYSVVLFDEIEKAHPDVFNILLQILDEGHITDAQGRKVSFKNTIIIMTSNAGAQRIVQPKRLGFGVKEDSEADHNQMKEAVLEEVKKIFKPEFINRIDEMIVFHMLSEDDIKEIVKLLLGDLKKRALNQTGIKLSFSEDAIDFLAKAGFDKVYGARPVKRAIQTNIEDKLAEEIVNERVKGEDDVEVITVDIDESDEEWKPDMEIKKKIAFKVN
ncbi:MAG: ATP-dependent Clp protease ATP-binding subunit [Lachnospiraceae bacterium]|nr:ATP-dependent Clp protease ATP-binding subunit [Lachnospiraceae bacterium]